MPFRYVGANGGNVGEQQLYYEEREKAQRGNSFQRGSRGQQQPPSPRYGPDPRDPRYRNGFRGGDRHTVDRERFPKYNEPDGYEEDDDVEEPNIHLSRRDRLREREPGPSTPQQHRHLMRHSEDRQTGGSPRYQRAGGEEAKFTQFKFGSTNFIWFSFTSSIVGSSDDATRPSHHRLRSGATV